MNAPFSLRHPWTMAALLSGVLAAAVLGGCAEAPEELDAFIEHQMERGRIPALSAAVIADNRVVWTKGFGDADIAAGIPAAPDTLFHLASISKTVTGTAVMQLAERGLLDLDQDVNACLPYSIRNPRFPDTPVTIRMLLTHTSSLLDNPAALGTLYTYGADSPISLDELIRGMFLPDGKWYRASRCFSRARPGTEFSYSNLGFALLGLVVERVSGRPFDAYCRESIFQPLGMAETDWFLARLNGDHIAMPYRDQGILRPRYRPYGQYGYPDYPSGQVRTSAVQLAEFLLAFMNNGERNGALLLRPETAAAMLERQIPDIAPEQALVWNHFTVGETPVIGHGGGEQGTLTMAFFTEDRSCGVVLLTTGDPVHGILRTRNVVKAFTALYERLLLEALTAANS